MDHNLLEARVIEAARLVYAEAGRPRCSCCDGHVVIADRINEILADAVEALDAADEAARRRADALTAHLKDLTATAMAPYLREDRDTIAGFNLGDAA